MEMETKKENGCALECETERGVAETPETGGKIGSAGLGKFKDANALLQAYSALEAEFTRRSQRLKEYERASANGKTEEARENDDAGNTPRDERAESAPPEATAEKTPEYAEVCPAERENGETEATPIQTGPIAADHPVREYAKAFDDETLFSAAMANESVRLKIVGEYLNSLKKSGATLAKGGTGTLGVLPKKAGNIAEAGRMALGLFQNAKFKGE